VKVGRVEVEKAVKVFRRGLGKILGVNLEERATKAVRQALPAKVEDLTARHLARAVQDLQTEVMGLAARHLPPVVRDLPTKVKSLAERHLDPAAKEPQEKAGEDQPASALPRVAKGQAVKHPAPRLHPMVKDQQAKVEEDRAVRELHQAAYQLQLVREQAAKDPAVKVARDLAVAKVLPARDLHRLDPLPAAKDPLH
jgi:hypothetical protein